MSENKQIKLAARPVGVPKSTDWEFTSAPLPELSDGEVLVNNIYISLDPAMRGWMNDSKSYIAPVGIGEVMRAGAVGKVVASKDPEFKEGDHVVGVLGVQTYAKAMGKELRKVPAGLAPLPTFLSTLGMTGLTAYFGILDVGALKDGEVVVVSGAAGAVGSIVGQIAKIKGCTVVGIAGGETKCNYVVNELGFDACIDYKNEDINEALNKHTPKGVDVYFDNVGGKTLDILLTKIRMKARIVICGAISQYNNTTPIQGPSNYLSLLVNRARMEGFVVFDFTPRYLEGIMQMGQWMKEGKLKGKEHIVEGIENFPDTLLMLFKGENYGKLMLQVSEE